MKCDELNVYHHELRHNEYAEFYLKYEVDKVIEGKDAKILALDAEVFKQKHHAKLFLDERNYAESQIEGKDEEIRRLKHALWKLKALYFYRMFQWSMEGKRFAPEDDEPEDFFMECLGKHTKRKSVWAKEADMFDDVRIVCIKKAEEYK